MLKLFSFCSMCSGRSMPAWAPPADDTQICGDDAADEIMERIVRSATQGPGTRAQPRERRRSRANRKSRTTLKIKSISHTHTVQLLSCKDVIYLFLM